MKELNDSIADPIKELSLLSNTLTTLKSRQVVYNTLLEEATRLQSEVALELDRNGYRVNGSSNKVPDYINALRRSYNSYQTTIDHYTSISNSN